MEKNYVVYHLHSMLSNGVTNIDSVTKYTEYIDYAKSLNMKALAFSEHGCIFEWVHKKEAIETAGMKYLHCVEAYLTEDCDENCVSYSAIDLLSSELLGYDVRFTFRHYWQTEEGAWLATVDEHPNSDMVGKTVMYSPSDVKKSIPKPEIIITVC